MEKKKFYMTTAIAYASGKPHIGNTYELYWQTALPVIRDSRVTMYFSRPEPMSMARRLS